jgi:hypothetical protein
MPLLAGLLLMLLPAPAMASWQVTCACEWNPFTHVNYLSCAELRPDGRANPLVSQLPFNSESECTAAASRAQTGGAPSGGREPAASRAPEEVSCECDWNPWRANFLLSCTGWYGDGPSVRILDRLPFGGPKGRKGEAERSCMAAKSSIEKKTR